MEHGSDASPYTPQLAPRTHPHLPRWAKTRGPELTGSLCSVDDKLRGHRDGLQPVGALPGRSWLSPWVLSQPGHPHRARPLSALGGLGVTSQPCVFLGAPIFLSRFCPSAKRISDKAPHFLFYKENNSLGKRVMGAAHFRVPQRSEGRAGGWHRRIGSSRERMRERPGLAVHPTPGCQPGQSALRTDVGFMFGAREGGG